MRHAEAVKPVFDSLLADAVDDANRVLLAAMEATMTKRQRREYASVASVEAVGDGWGWYEETGLGQDAKKHLATKVRLCGTSPSTLSLTSLSLSLSLSLRHQGASLRRPHPIARPLLGPRPSPPYSPPLALLSPPL